MGKVKEAKTKKKKKPKTNNIKWDGFFKKSSHKDKKRFKGNEKIRGEHN